MSGIVRRGRVERLRDGASIGIASYALTQHARHVATAQSSAIVRAVRIDLDAAGRPLVALASVQLGRSPGRPLWDVPVSDAERAIAQKVRVCW